jgi:hypothetical protein
MTAELDRLDVELRSIPGVIAVGFDREDPGLVVQVVVTPAVSGHDLRERVRRVIRVNVREPVGIELVIDSLNRVAR